MSTKKQKIAMQQSNQDIVISSKHFHALEVFAQVMDKANRNAEVRSNFYKGILDDIKKHNIKNSSN